MSPELLLTARLAAHGFEPAKFESPFEVVQALGAVQAQDYGQSLWAIGSRIPGSTRSDVENAINRFEIIRTWSMRGTIHFVPAEDAKWMLDLLTPRITAKLKPRRTLLNISDDTLTHCGSILKKELRGNTLLSRPRIFQLFEDAGESTTNQRGYHILLELAQRGLIFIGPNEGKQPTFGLLDEFVESRNLTRNESLRELAVRFFASHAPATVADFAYWSGLTLTDARHAVDLASDTLKQFEIDGVIHLADTSFVAPSAAITHSVHLMAGFDEYLLPYRNRHTIIDADHADYVVPGGNGVFKPMLVMNGRVVGVWARQVKSKSTKVTMSVFPGISVAADQLTPALAAYEHFVGTPIESIFIKL